MVHCRLERTITKERTSTDRSYPLQENLEKTKNMDYFQYLVKWKNQPLEDATCRTEMEIYKYNVDLEELLKIFFLPLDYDA